MGRIDRALWAGTLGSGLAIFVYLLLRNNPSDTHRVTLTTLALLTPLLTASLMDGDFRPQTFLKDRPSPLILLLCMGCGAVLWPPVRWATEAIARPLFEQFGLYSPQFVVIEPWGLQVLYEVVLLPIAISLLVFGLIRFYLQNTPTLAALFIPALFFGLIAAIVTPHGTAAILPYGGIGLVGSFLAWRTRSVWAGLAVYFGFAYVSLAFFDEFQAEVDGLALDSTPWLTWVFGCAFVALILTQIVRFRIESESAAKRPHSDDDLMTLMGWVAAGLLIVAALFYGISELDQRNENQSASQAR